MITTLGGKPYYRFVGEYERQDTAEKVASACARCNHGTTFRVLDDFGEVAENFTCNEEGMVTMHWPFDRREAVFFLCVDIHQKVVISFGDIFIFTYQTYKILHKNSF